MLTRVQRAKIEMTEPPSHTHSTSLSVLSKPSLIVICGATATGKSGLAISLVQELQQTLGCQASILGADSRQVYREFNIGTAKPSPWEQTLVPHGLIDICDPDHTFTLAEFQAHALAQIQHCHQQGMLPLLVGGTGLYIKSIVRGLNIPRVAPQPGLRSQLQRWGQAQCYQVLQQVDAIAASKIHPHDAVRTLRALEVFYVTGQPMSAQQGENPPSYPILQLGLDSGQLDQRIEQRTAQMLRLGLVAEVKGLIERYGWELPLLNTLGYAEIKQSLRGDLTLEDAERFIAVHTRQFAKRQRTWFRADPQIEWFDSDVADLPQQVYQRVIQFLHTVLV
jgi:tRNA dimethylallyltransferase